VDAGKLTCPTEDGGTFFCLGNQFVEADLTLTASCCDPTQVNQGWVAKRVAVKSSHQTELEGVIVGINSDTQWLGGFVLQETLFVAALAGVVNHASRYAASSFPTPSSGSSEARLSLEAGLSTCFSGWPSLTSAGGWASSASLETEDSRVAKQD